MQTLRTIRAWNMKTTTLRSGSVNDVFEQAGRALSFPSLDTHLKSSAGNLCSYCLQEKLKASLQRERIRKNTGFVSLLCDCVLCILEKGEGTNLSANLRSLKHCVHVYLLCALIHLCFGVTFESKFINIQHRNSETLFQASF